MPESEGISKKRKEVKDGVFRAELNELFTRELAQHGYSGVEVKPSQLKTEIIIKATRTKDVLGTNARRIRELTAIVQKRFGFKEGSVEIYAERVPDKGLCAVAQAESLRYKLLGGLAVRRACYAVLRFVMEQQAKGCEVIVSGKLRAQRAKSMKFRDGYILSSGDVTRHYIDTAVRHVLLRQGVLGIKVMIMKPHDPQGKKGPRGQLPDVVEIEKPKDEDLLPQIQSAPAQQKIQDPVAQITSEVPPAQVQPDQYQPQGDFGGNFAQGGGFEQGFGYPQQGAFDQGFGGYGNDGNLPNV